MQALLGAQEGLGTFHAHKDQSSVLPNSQGKAFGEKIQTRVVTLDGVIKELHFPWPDLIKLDLQGYELECLKGGFQALSGAQAVIAEANFFRFQGGQPLFTDVVAFMERSGYRLYDILNLWVRPLDGALAQGDFLFLRKDHPLCNDNRWSNSSAFS